VSRSSVPTHVHSAALMVSLQELVCATPNAVFCTRKPMSAGTPICAADHDRIAGRRLKAGQMPHPRPLLASGPAECTHAADAGGCAGRPGRRAAVAARRVMP
jgi:hypothetical protein